MTVDTACSSSLVALHLACQALRAGECYAGAGRRRDGDGHPGRVRRVLPAAGAGRRRPVQGVRRRRGRHRLGRGRRDAGAWSGCRTRGGNGHPVLAVVRGTAVNQDGASNGLTAPNGPSQQRVIRAALASAGLAPGRRRRGGGARHRHQRWATRSRPRRCMATYGQDRAGRPAAAGSARSSPTSATPRPRRASAGVIKMVLAMRHGAAARRPCTSTSHRRTWTGRRATVRLLTEPVPWPGAAGRPRRAGVSSFGVSGTNAHVILEEAPAARRHR